MAADFIGEPNWLDVDASFQLMSMESSMALRLAVAGNRLLTTLDLSNEMQFINITHQYSNTESNTYRLIPKELRIFRVFDRLAFFVVELEIDCLPNGFTVLEFP